MVNKVAFVGFRGR